MNTKRGFTLIEFLVVIATIGILAALLFPALSQAHNKGRQTTCTSNLKQINLAIHLYADDCFDGLPVVPEPNPYPNGVGAYYKQLVKGYLELTGPASPGEKVFICPCDTTMWKQVGHAYTSYTFNGYEIKPAAIPRITGQKMSSIKRPGKAALVGEWPAFFGGSWHPLTTANHLEVRNVLSYVDGHVNFPKIYWNGVANSSPCDYEPPVQYEYNWDGE